MAEHLRLRKSQRNQDPVPDDQSPVISTSNQSTGCRPSVVALISSPFSGDDAQANNRSKSQTGGESRKNFFASGALRSLGCAASSSQVSLPAAIRASAGWRAGKLRKEKQKRVSPHQPPPQSAGITGDDPSSSPSDVCGRLAASDASRRSVSGEGKLDGDKPIPQERSLKNGGRRANPRKVFLLEAGSGFGRTRPGSDVFEARYYRHAQHRSPEELAEIMLFGRSILMEGRPNVFDRHREWRLDVDHMSYEELLQLGDQIGHVHTGLREDEIKGCLRNTRLSITKDRSVHLSAAMGSECSICQEEYGEDDEMGGLDCGHFYHTDCIKKWLSQKNTCPVCKSEAAARKAEWRL